VSFSGDALRGFLARRWFLLLLGLGVALACALPEALSWTAWLDPRFVVASALFLMSWTLPTQNLLRSVTQPGPSLWACVISYGLVPALAWVLGRFLPADFGVGLLISAAVPCTLASAALWTRRAGGDDATAILVTLLTTSTSWLITTLWLTLGAGTKVAHEGPAMMLDLVSTLIVPVGLGQLARAVGTLRFLVTRHRSILGFVAQMLVLMILFKAAVLVAEKYRQGAGSMSMMSLTWIALACVGVHVSALLFGLWSSKLWGFDRPRQIAVAFACSQKTLPVALLLFERHFRTSYPLAVVPLAFYHLGQLIVDTFIADYLAARRGGEEQTSTPVDL
jgi:sodium/bile acid cotransporter 7